MIVWPVDYVLFHLVANIYLAVIICFFHEEEQQDEAETSEYRTPVLGDLAPIERIFCRFSHQNPFPSLSGIDEPRKHIREKITANENEAIKRYIGPTFMREILRAESETRPARGDILLLSLCLKGDMQYLSTISHTKTQAEPRKIPAAACWQSIAHWCSCMAPISKLPGIEASIIRG